MHSNIWVNLIQELKAIESVWRIFLEWSVKEYEIHADSYSANILDGEDEFYWKLYSVTMEGILRSFLASRGIYVVVKPLKKTALDNLVFDCGLFLLRDDVAEKIEKNEEQCTCLEDATAYGIHRAFTYLINEV